jgi:hypothetical protein
MRLWFDPMKMAAYDVSFSDVQAALNRQNVELPAGKVTGSQTELTVRTIGRLQTEADFERLIIKNVNGSDIHVGEIADVVLGPENEETQLEESGVPMVALAIIPQPGSNYVAIAEEFYKRFDQIKKDVPPDIKLNIALDNTGRRNDIHSLCPCGDCDLSFLSRCTYFYSPLDRYSRQPYRGLLYHVYHGLYHQHSYAAGHSISYRACGG